MNLVVLGQNMGILQFLSYYCETDKPLRSAGDSASAPYFLTMLLYISNSLPSYLDSREVIESS